MLGALALLGLSGCKTTPLDVVYAVDAVDGAAGDAAAGGGGAGAGVGGSAGAGAGAAGNPAIDAGTCSMVGPGLYVLRSKESGLCLGQGAPTTVFGNPGYVLDFSFDCRRPDRSWQLSATATPNVFSLQNLAPPGFVLDVKMAAIADGTPVITFGENGFDNQRFEVRARGTYTSELRPQHHPQSCVSASGESAQITACDTADPTQAWQLQRSDCL